MAYGATAERFSNLSTSEKLRILRQLDDWDREEIEAILEVALSDRAAKVRLLALTQWARRLPLEREMVLRFLQDSAKTVRQKALKLIQTWPDPELIPHILPFLESDDIGLRLLAVDWLYMLGKEGLPYLESLADDPMFSVREKARHYIRDLHRQTQKPPVLPELSEASSSPQASTGAPRREWKRVLEDLRNEPEEVWSDALKKVLEYGGEEAVCYLVMALDDPRWSWREAIIHALQAMDDCPTSFFHPLLEHPLWYMRAAAIEILGHHKDPALLDAALVLCRDSNVEVRRALAEVLAHYGREEEALLALEKLVHDEHFLIRRIARKQLEKLRAKKGESVP